MSKSRPLPFYDEKAALIATMKPRKLIQTRRPIKPQPALCCGCQTCEFKGNHFLEPPPLCPHGIAGDKIWVREAYRFHRYFDTRKPSEVCEDYPLDYNIHYEVEDSLPKWIGRYRHARFMPKWASRSLLTIVEVRAERVQEISAEDVVAEGLPDLIAAELGATEHFLQFENLWDKFYAGTKYAWMRDPFVWALTLRKE